MSPLPSSYLLQLVSSLLQLLLCGYRGDSELWRSTATTPPTDEAHCHLRKSTNQINTLLTFFKIVKNSRGGLSEAAVTDVLF